MIAAATRITKMVVKLSLVCKLALCHGSILKSGGIAPHILDLGIRWGKWSASHPSHFVAEENFGVRGWVDPTASHRGEENIIRTSQEFNLGHPSCNPVTIQTEQF